jgi:hypothetical protein
MESLVSVESEVDKALDAFSEFYEQVDENVDKVIEALLSNIADVSKSK